MDTPSSWSDSLQYRGSGTHLLHSRTASAVRWGAGPATEGCNSIVSSRPGEEGVPQHLFPGTQGDGDRRPILNWSLQIKCLQDFVLDGDTAIHQSCHASTWIWGRLLPRMSGHSTPLVPQIQLAGHKLPIRNPSVWPVISPLSLHKTGPSHGMADTLGSPAIRLPQWLPHRRRVWGRGGPVRPNRLFRSSSNLRL